MLQNPGQMSISSSLQSTARRSITTFVRRQGSRNMCPRSPIDTAIYCPLLHELNSVSVSRSPVRDESVHPPVGPRCWSSSRCFWSHPITRVNFNSTRQLRLQVGARTGVRHSAWPQTRSSHTAGRCLQRPISAHPSLRPMRRRPILAPLDVA